MKQALPHLLFLFLSIGSGAFAQQRGMPADPVPTSFVREWLVEAGGTIPFDGPVADQEYRELGLPMQHIRIGHRITREIWVHAAYDHFKEVRESSGACPEGVFPCPDTFVDNFRFHAVTLNARWTFARSPNADAFVGAGFGAADIRRYYAHLFKIIAPLELGVKGWVQRGQQFQWGPVVSARTIFGLDGQESVSGGAKIGNPMLLGLSFGLFARW